MWLVRAIQAGQTHANASPGESKNVEKRQRNQEGATCVVVGRTRAQFVAFERGGGSEGVARGRGGGGVKGQ